MKAYHSEAHSTMFWKCTKCDKQHAVLKGTPFFRSRLTLGTIFHILLNFFIKASITITSLQFGVSRDTVAYYYSIARASQAVRISEMFEPLGGPGSIVEVDEAILRKRKYKKGRRKPQIWLLGAVERKEGGGQGRIWIRRIPNRKKDTLLPLLSSHIKPGTTIYTDEWRAYLSLPSLGFEHKTVCHKYTFKDAESGVCTNCIEGVWSQLRRSLPTCGIKDKFIDDFIASFISRNEETLQFPDFIQAVAKYRPEKFEIPEEVHELEEDSEESNDAPVLPEDEEGYLSSDDVGDGSSSTEWDEKS